jgi:hypothetical protein
MPTRVRSMSPSDVAARQADARSYLDAARMFVESTTQADWRTAGANAVLGGIAASDAICGHVLGHHSRGEDHADARRLLDRACTPDTQPGNNLRRLIDEKSNFQYSTTRVTQDRTRGLVTALERLVATMEALAR